MDVLHTDNGTLTKHRNMLPRKYELKLSVGYTESFY